MTDTDKLKRLAEDLRFNGRLAAETEREAATSRNERNDRAAATILALIAENGRLKAVNVKRAASIADLAIENERLKGKAHQEYLAAVRRCEERDEAVALLRGLDKVRMCDEEWAPVAAFLARIDGGV